MKILHWVLVAIIALLGIGAGVAKILESPEEVQFLETFGFNSILIVLYGLVQVIGGTLLAIPKTVKLGSIITILAFALSTILIAISGNYVFALFSLLPIAFTALIFWQSNQLSFNN